MKKKCLEDEWLEIINKNNFVGYLNGNKVYSNLIIPEGVVYFINDDYMGTPTTKKGKPDMRYKINKYNEQFKI